MYTCCIWGTGEIRTGFGWGRPDGKRPLDRPRVRWDDGIKMGFKKVGSGGVKWIDLA